MDGDALWAKLPEAKRGRSGVKAQEPAPPPSPAVAVGASSLRRLQAYPGLVFVHCGGEGNCGWNCLG
eukprot:2925241-Alexandrium_andersonii.AAC.1